MDVTKITAKVYQPMWLKFQKNIRELFLNRDAFLDHIISVETPHLRDDLAGRAMSRKAKTYVSRELNLMGHAKQQGLIRVSIATSKETATNLGVVVKESNLVRDAFINRLLFFLLSTDKVLNFFGVPLRTGGLKHAESFSTNPMQAMMEIRDDPFFYIRESLLERGETGMYTVPLTKGLMGFSCYLGDKDVPGTKEHEKFQKELQELLAL